MGRRPADRIRNVALIGHRGSGKTSLTEALLYEAGIVNRLGRVEDGTTVADYEPDEQARQMSIGVALTSFEHDGRKINLIDTPGDPSFLAEALAALHVVDAAVVVVNGVMGVEVNTDRLWRRAADENLTLREIGEVLGVTESRVSQLHTKAVLGLRSNLQPSWASESS